LCQIKIAPLKQVLSIALIALMLVQTASKIWIYSSFKINQDFIAKNLCENRFKNLECKGQCVLMKKLQKAQEKEESRQCNFTKEKFDVFDFNNSSIGTLILQRICISVKQSIFFYLTHITSSVDFDIFHPPQ
jgi:hypothetical protein